MAGAVFSLASGEPLDPKPILAGSWHSLQKLGVRPFSTHRLEPGPLEYCVFVIEGDGVAAIDDRRVPLAPSTALVVLRGSGADLIADQGGLEALVVTVRA